eukprot:scaffold2576_cov175-Amphora_coffeaeformis.AAC.9
MRAAVLTRQQPPLRATNGAAKDDEEDIDLFEYFDPLLSPHAYPDGISPNKKPVETKQSQKEEDVSPIVKKTFGFDLSPGAGSLGVSLEPPQASGQRGAEQVDTAEIFDPRISPHEYTNGTPDKVFGFEQEQRSVTRIGILLMDHGSRNPASNERLKNLARVYQETLNDSNIVVRYAHMEIAQPSIPEALETLLNEGVDEIVCHPYFLSPGRHVKEDIPEIVQSAIESLDITIPIVTTNPVGSETDIMIRAIHSAVKRTAAFT